MNFSLRYILAFILMLFFTFSHSQKTKKETNNEASLYSGLKFRSIGPAFMSGRIADIAINPSNENEWYVAVGSGGVWKTSNSGTTWIPLTDDQSFYSTGSITIDPNNNNTVWLGTGENVGGRHVGIGKGVYVSHNGGKTWQTGPERRQAWRWRALFLLSSGKAFQQREEPLEHDVRQAGRQQDLCLAERHPHP